MCWRFLVGKLIISRDFGVLEIEVTDGGQTGKLIAGGIFIVCKGVVPTVRVFDLTRGLCT